MPMISDYFECKLIGTPTIILQLKQWPHCREFLSLFTNRDCKLSQFSEINWYFVPDCSGNIVILYQFDA